MIERIKAPMTYDPGKGRPKEHLAYLNKGEMAALRRMNGDNKERGPKGLPSFPPADAAGSSSKAGSTSKSPSGTTSKSSGPGGGSLSSPSRTTPSSGSNSGGGNKTASGGSSGGGIKSGSSSGYKSNKGPAGAATAKTADTRDRQRATVSDAVKVARESAPLNRDAKMGGIKSINVGPMQTPVKVGDQPHISGAMQRVQDANKNPMYGKPPSAPPSTEKKDKLNGVNDLSLGTLMTDPKVMWAAKNDYPTGFAYSRDLVSGVGTTYDPTMGGFVTPTTGKLAVNPEKYGPTGSLGDLGDIYSHEAGHLATRAMTSAPAKAYSNPFAEKDFLDVGVADAVRYAMNAAKDYLNPSQTLNVSTSGLDALNNNVAALSRPGSPGWMNSTMYNTTVGNEVMSRLADRNSAIKKNNLGLRMETDRALSGMLPDVFGGKVYTTVATGRNVKTGYTPGSAEKKAYVEGLYKQRDEIARQLMNNDITTAYEVQRGLRPPPSGGVSDLWGGWSPEGFYFSSGTE